MLIVNLNGLHDRLETSRFRRRGDTQELTAQLPAAQPIDLESSGGYLGDGGCSFFKSELENFFAGSYTNEVMRTAEEYLESLRGKVWLIPKNFVEVLDISGNSS